MIEKNPMVEMMERHAQAMTEAMQSIVRANMETFAAHQIAMQKTLEANMQVAMKLTGGDVGGMASLRASIDEMKANIAKDVAALVNGIK